MSEETAVKPSIFEKSYANPFYRWYTVAILMLVYACHALDRGLPNILVEPVRHEFGLNDTQLGLFTGLAFGLSFAVAGIPIGIISDRVNRRNMLAIAILVWSAFTAFGGLARNFGMLVLSRVGVGAAEASAAPIAMPMIVDIFPKGRRSFALGIFYMSPALGSFLAAVVGAWIAVHFGWRAAFLIAGIPGIILAIVLFLTLKEPARGASDRIGADDGAADIEGTDEEPAPPLKEVLLYLFKSPGILCLTLGASLVGLLSITFGAWTTSFFIRIHGFDLVQAGLVLGVGGMVSVFSPPLFGWLSDRLSLRDPRWSLRIVWIAAIFIFVVGMTGVMIEHAAMAFFCFVFIDFVRSGYPPPSYVVLMTAAPPRMRGTVMSIMQFTVNLMGFGAGPIVAGALSDSFGGEDGLRYSLATILFICFLIVPLLMIANYYIFERPRKLEQVAR